MKKTLLYLLCATAALSSCKDDDDDNNDPAGGGSGSAATRVASVAFVEDGAQTYASVLSYEGNKLNEQIDYVYEGGAQPVDSSLTLIEYSGSDITQNDYEIENGTWQLFDSEIRTFSGDKLITTQYYANGTTGALSSEVEYLYNGDQLTQRISTDYFGGDVTESTFNYIYSNDRLIRREQLDNSGNLFARLTVTYTGSNATSVLRESQSGGNWQSSGRTDYTYTNGVVTSSSEYFYDFFTQEPELVSTETYLYNGAGQVVTITYTDPDDMTEEITNITYENGANNLNDIFGDPENGLLYYGPDIF